MKPCLYLTLYHIYLLDDCQCFDQCYTHRLLRPVCCCNLELSSLEAPSPVGTWARTNIAIDTGVLLIGAVRVFIGRSATAAVCVRGRIVSIVIPSYSTCSPVVF